MDGKKHPKKVKFKKNFSNKQDKHLLWVIGICIASFIISIIFTLISTNIMNGSSFIFSISIVLFIIIIAILSDIIGVAVTACNETPFYSMASRKIMGAKTAIILCKNADRVSTFFNDVVGDICGIISGVATSYIIIVIIGNKGMMNPIELVITGIVAALTVGGKSFGKTIAIKFSGYIVYWLGVILEFLLNKRKGILSFAKRK